MQVGEYADMMAAEHQKVWDGIHIGYTHFVRTSTPEHRDFVQKMLQKSYDNGDIYEGIYEGMYCVGCEAFKKESDVVNGKCPDHPTKELQYIKEKNYFFRLSRYQNQLEEFYKAHPDFIYPANRSAEIYEFVRGGLEDFSISRETNTYGIPLPWDPKQVTYVWYDALFNYMTYCQEDEKKWWPADIHVI
jgi:methionyl-tRNA synthetase